MKKLLIKIKELMKSDQIHANIIKSLELHPTGRKAYENAVRWMKKHLLRKYNHEYKQFQYIVGNIRI